MKSSKNMATEGEHLGQKRYNYEPGRVIPVKDDHLENALVTLIRQSHNWASVERWIEVFYAARDMLQNYYNVESGYFVYRKTVLGTDEEKTFRVYAPWGMPQNGQDVMFQRVLEQLRENPDPVKHVSEQWISVEEAPGYLKTLWKEWGIRTGGSWLLSIGSVPVGMAVFHRRVHRVDDTVVMSLVVRQISLVMELLRYRRQAEEASQRDPLTGIYNRRGATMRIETLLALRDSRAGEWIFAIFDVDDFKTINDNLGHPHGDGVLIEVARILSSHLREGDICGRWGGDEFVVMLKSPGHLASSIIERLKKKVASELRDVSVSAGWAVWGVEGTNLEEIYRVADKRLYQDKADACQIWPKRGDGE